MKKKPTRKQLLKYLKELGYFAVGIWHKDDIVARAEMLDISLSPEQVDEVYNHIENGENPVSFDVIDNTIHNLFKFEEETGP